jgi:septum formation protein
VVPEVDEVSSGEPEEAVVENARHKALAGRRAAAARGLVGESTLVLGADTEVVLDGRMLGKASDDAGARARLASLSGRAHTVLSGVVILAPAGAGGMPRERSGVARSEVTFRRLDAATIDSYLDSGEWRDRAGAYAIQGLGSILVERVAGDFSNVVGLPVGLILELAPELREPG